MISVVIPVSNVEDATNTCIQHLTENEWGGLEIIIIDNASATPYFHDKAETIYNTKNKGFWPSMLQGIEAARNDIVMCMHNDVFLYDTAFDMRITSAFQADDKLATAGLFGARGVAVNGGRIHPEGNMLGRKYGTAQTLHGHIQTGMHPSVVFDSLCMIFDRTKLYSIEYKDIPPHHWTDLLVTLRLLKAGYRASTIGIAFDHGGGWTSSTKTMNTFIEDWCREKGLELNQNWDYTLYKYGEALFKQEFLEFTQGHNELHVDKDYNLFAQ